MFMTPARRQRLACRCSHERAAHEHYNGATNCALCECHRWSPGLMRRLLRRWRLGRTQAMS